MEAQGDTQLRKEPALAKLAALIIGWRWAEGELSAEENRIMPRLLLGLYVGKPRGGHFNKTEAAELMGLEIGKTAAKYVQRAVDLGWVRISRWEGQGGRAQDLLEPTAMLFDLIGEQLALLKGTVAKYGSEAIARSTNAPLMSGERSRATNLRNDALRHTLERLSQPASRIVKGRRDLVYQMYRAMLRRPSPEVRTAGSPTNMLDLQSIRLEAEKLYEKGAPQEAIAVLKNGTQAQTRWVAGYLDRAVYQFLIGNFAGARKDVKKASGCKLYWSEKRALQALSAMLAWETSKSRALDWINEAVGDDRVERDIGTAWALLIRGLLHQELGDLDKALDDISSAREIDPDIVKVLNDLIQ